MQNRKQRTKWRLRRHLGVGPCERDPTPPPRFGCLIESVCPPARDLRQVHARSLENLSSHHGFGAKERRKLGRRAPQPLGRRVVVWKNLVARRTLGGGEFREVIGVVDTGDESASRSFLPSRESDAGLHRLVPKHGLTQRKKRSVRCNPVELRQCFAAAGTGRLHRFLILR